MFDYRNNSYGFIKKSSKSFNNISKKSYSNSFLLDSLISDLYEGLLKLVPERIAIVASINSRNSFEYFLYYRIEDIKLTLKNNNYNWSLCYKVNASYLDTKNKPEQSTEILDANIIIISLKDFYLKNVKKYYH